MANNSVAVGDVAELIGKVHGALARLGMPLPLPFVEQVSAVAVRGSVMPDHLVCLEGGKELKMLRRHLAADHGMTPAEYRDKWKLPDSYPWSHSIASSFGVGSPKRLV